MHDIVWYSEYIYFSLFILWNSTSLNWKDKDQALEDNKKGIQNDNDIMMNGLFN